MRPQQGIGWSQFGGPVSARSTVWPYPEARVGGLRVIDDANESHLLIWDSYDGIPRKFGNPDNFTDDAEEYQGTEIEAAIKFKEDIGSAEHFILENSEQHTHFRPESEERGFRDDFAVTLINHVDGSPTANATARSVPTDGDITYDKTQEGHRQQMELRTTASEWKLVERRTYYVAKDRAAAPSGLLMSEIDWQEELSVPILWLSRGTALALNRIDNTTLTGTFFGATTGPDAYEQSAIRFNAAGSLTWAMTNVLGDFTMMAWLNQSSAFDIFRIGNMSLRWIQPDVVWADAGNVFDAETTNDGTTWLHIAVRRQESTLTIYVNGVAVSTNVLGPFNNVSGDVVIGNAQTGDIFDVRIFDSALSSDAIAYAYRDVNENSGDAICPVWI